jgi:uncharacterized protein (TIGR00255 family)
MIKSMTGFGRGTFQNGDVAIAVTISTVNHRFGDVQLRLPEELAALESRLRAVVLNVCQRGRINVTVGLEQTRDVLYELNRPMIRGYLAALQMMKQEFSISGEVDINTLTLLPKVVQPASTLSDLDETLGKGLEQAVSQALASVVEMRVVEGREIAREMSARLDVIWQHLDLIEREAHQVLPLARERLLKRLEEFNTDTGIDETRLAQEVILLAQRNDISEEIARLKSHIEQYRGLLAADEPVGKKLDFLLQEMNREANTIQAKSSGLTIARAAIEIRTEIEKLREQVQNVE